MKLILVARNAFAAYLIISALARSVSTSPIRYAAPRAHPATRAERRGALRDDHALAAVEHPTGGRRGRLGLGEVRLAGRAGRSADADEDNLRRFDHARQVIGETEALR